VHKSLNHLIVYYLVNIISPAPNRRWHYRWCCLMYVCLSVCLTSVAYMRPKSRTERPRKTKIGTDVAHVTRDSDTTFKVKRLKVKVTRPLYLPLCWRVRHLQRWAWERVGRGKLLQCCYVAVCTARWRFGAHRGGKGRGISWLPPTTVCFASIQQMHNA